MKKVDQKHWRKAWTPREAQEIAGLADFFRRQGAPNDREAWSQAELKYARQTLSPSEQKGLKPHA